MSNDKQQTQPNVKATDVKQETKPAVPAQPADKPAETKAEVKELRALESFDETLAGAIRMLNGMAKQHNEEVNYLKTKSGDKEVALKAISESDDVKDIMDKRDRLATLREAIERVEKEIRDLAEHEYTTNVKYAPLTPEKIAEKQTKIDDVRKKWQNGFNGLEMLAMMSGTSDDDLAYLRENHVNAIVKQGRKSHNASTSGGETTIMRKRVRNIRIVKTDDAGKSVESPISDDLDSHTFGKLSAKLKDFSVKLGSAEIAQMAISAYDKGNGWDDVPDVDAAFPIVLKSGTTYIVKFDKQ